VSLAELCKEATAWCFAGLQVDISKVVTLCKLLESLLLVQRGVDFKLDAAKLNPIVCTTFVFAYVWGIGGNLIDSNFDTFDTFVRKQFDDVPEAKVFHVFFYSSSH
jgi:dynein heavy chain, axonemal